MPAALPSPSIAVRAGLNTICSALLCFAAAGCADLQVLSPDVCGNGALEPDAGEECDGDAGCGAPGTQHACRILCDAAPGTPCGTDGYRCGTDGVCRKPSGAFVEMAYLPTGTTLDVFTGDVNQDGCHEIFLTTRQSVQITAFEGREPGACPASAQSLPFGKAPEKQLSRSAPFLADVTGDGRPDLLRPGDAQFGDSLFVHASGSTPEVAPILYPTVKASEEKVRPLKIGFGERDALLLFIDLPMGPGGGGDILNVGVAGVVDPQRIPINLGKSLPGKLDDLVILTAVDLGPVPLPPGQVGLPCDACEEVLAGMAGTSVIQRLSVIVAADGPEQTMVMLPIQPVITLPAGAKLRRSNAAIALADIDMDQRLDAVLNTEGSGLFVAYGTGDGRFHSTSPPDLAAPDGKVSPFGMAPPELASQDFLFVAAELDEDKPGPELVPIPCPPADVLESSACAPIPGGCEAVVADIDHDDLPDIVATQNQEPGLLVHRAGGSVGFQTSFVDTRCPVHHLATGDFDNDGIHDIAYFDQTMTSAAAGSEAPATTLMIVYGNAFAAPAVPEESGLFDDAQGLTAGRFTPDAPGTQLYAARGIGDAMLKSGFALVEGYGERRLFAPFYFPPKPDDGQSFTSVEMPAAAGGRFIAGEGTAGARSAVAVVTLDDSGDPAGGKEGSERLWLIDGRDAGSILDASSQQGPAPPACAECVLVPIDVLPAGARDGVDELLLLSGNEATLWSVVPAGGGELRAFEMTSSFTTERSFSSVDREPKPEKHVSRPLVADLDGDGPSDVVLRSAEGSLAVLWASPGGGFEEGELIDAGRCGGTCSAALLDLDGDGARELLAVLPDGVEAYQVTPSRALVPFPAPAALAGSPAGGTDFTAAVAADLDGDGAEDLVIMKSSTLAAALRAVPVIE